MNIYCKNLKKILKNKKMMLKRILKKIKYDIYDKNGRYKKFPFVKL